MLFGSSTAGNALRSMCSQTVVLSSRFVLSASSMHNKQFSMLVDETGYGLPCDVHNATSLYNTAKA